MTWILVAALAVLVVFLVVANVVGSRLPRDHHAVLRARYHQSPERIWQLITNMPDAPNWRSGLRRVERHADLEGKPVWIEVSRQGRMPLVFEEMEPPRRLVLRIADDRLPFGGTWTYAIVSDGEWCTLSIAEEGFIRSRFMRFWARFVSGYDGTIRKYLRDLGRKLGEKSAPERVP